MPRDRMSEPVQPVVTVVIPTYRRPDLVVRAVRSALNQTYPHVRVRVFDNASGDDTARAVGELARADPRVEYAVHAENIGAGANFSYAVAKVDTPLFVALSDDDLLLPHFLGEGVDLLRRHAEAGFHCAPSIVFHELAGGVRVQGASWAAGLYPAGAESARRMLREHFITTGVLFRRDVRTTIGDFGAFPLEREFVARGAALHPFTVSARIGGVLTVHERSFTAGVQKKGTDLSRSVGVGYARDCYVSAMTHVITVPLDAEGRALLLDAVRENTRRDMLYHLGFKALPAGAWQQIDEVLQLARELGFGAPTRFALRVLRQLGRVPLLSHVLRLTIGIVTRRLTRSKYEPFATTRHREIVDYVRSLSP
jgi:hypothetical protein